MPIIYQNSNRRQFLHTILGAAAAAVVNPLALAGDKNTIRLALLSDTHVPEDVENNYRGFYPYQNMGAVVSQVAATDLDGAVITGDLARLQGLPGDYANLKKLLQPLAGVMPVSMALGNHDNYENFTRAFTPQAGEQQPIDKKHVLVIEHPALRLIILDSLLSTNITPGLLGKKQRQWLKGWLQSHNDKATLLFVHHTLGDEDGDLMDVERLFKIIAPAFAVKAIVFGHSHQYRFDVRDGIQLINLPAVGYNFSDDQPVGWIEASLTAKEGEFKLHAVGGGKKRDGKTTKLIWRS